jgi:hypothetical protein
MAPSERAKVMRRKADRGCAEAQALLSVWHGRGSEGLEEDDVKAVAWFRKSADLGHVVSQSALSAMYFHGHMGVEPNYALAVEWGRKAADQGNKQAQFFVGDMYARGAAGVKKDLPLGKTYLEFSAAQGDQAAVELLKQLRKCVACGKLDVHHMICSRCQNRRYCDHICQLRHWNSATDLHKLHCVKRRESAGAGGSSSEHADTSADSN